MDTWFGVTAPRGTPDAVVARLNREIEAIAREPGFQDKLGKIGCAIAFKPQAEFKAFIGQESAKWQRLIPAMGIPQTD